MVAQLSHDRRLFGIDLSGWPHQWRAAGQWLLDSAPLRALTPAVPMRLMGLGDRRSSWLLRGDLAYPQVVLPAGAQPLPAVEIGPEDVLERRLMLPALGAADLDQAVRLEIQSSSPFAPEQTVFGYRVSAGEGGARQVDLALTSRQQCEAALARAGADAQAEIWLLPPFGERLSGKPWQPLVLRGWGEGARQRVSARGQRIAIGWLVLLLVLLAALIVTPVAFERLRARQAQSALDALQKQAAPQIALREALVRDGAALRAAGAVSARYLALPPVLDLLTRALPDSAWLTAIRVDDDKIVINGMADDSTALVRSLASQPGVSGARLSSPATRGAGDAKERFIIELHVDASRYGLTLPVLAAPPASAPASASASAPAPAPASAPASAAVAPPERKGAPA